MAQRWPNAASASTLTTSYLSVMHTPPSFSSAQELVITRPDGASPPQQDDLIRMRGSSTGKGILIGMLSAFGSAAFVAIIILIIYFFQYTQKGRILLDRLGRPGEFDDEQAFAKEEAEALEEMDDMQRMEYLRAKGMFRYSTTRKGSMS